MDTDLLAGQQAVALGKIGQAVARRTFHTGLALEVVLHLDQTIFHADADG